MQTITTIGLDIAMGLMARTGPPGAAWRRPLLRVQRTCRAIRATSESDRCCRKSPKLLCD